MRSSILFLLLIQMVFQLCGAASTTAAGSGDLSSGVISVGPDERLSRATTYEHPGDPALMASFDFEGPVFVEYGSMIKDHAFIFADGLYHLIYITDGEKSFGHATSVDLKDWTLHERVLWAEPEFNRIYAPHIVEFSDIPGYYLMYYTGVNDHISQETCLAFSTGDLSAWIPAVPERFEPYHPDTAWALWDETSWSNCRDPFFFIDTDDTGYLLNTATAKGNFGAISLARFDGFFDYEDIGPLYTHNNWHALESPFMIYRSGRYHLFFVEEEVGGISHMSSPSLQGGWDITYRAIIDNGHACELLDAGGGEYLFSRHSAYALPDGESLYSIRIDTLGWTGDLPEIRIEDPLGSAWTILRGTAFDRQPVFGDNPGWRGVDSVDVDFEGNWWIGTFERFDGPVLGALPGSFQGDGPTGAIRSGTFIVTGRSMRLLVGGGHYPETCYVALFDAATGTMLFSETGRGTDAMDERCWDLKGLRGSEVYLEIVDDSSLPFGHINVDGIFESPFPFQPALPPDEDGPPEKDIDDPKKGATNAVLIPTISMSSHPNPFNPATIIELSGLEPARYGVRIYDISGRLVRVLDVTASTDGRGSVRWNGLDSGGGPVVSGIYVAAAARNGKILSVHKLVLMR
ncbi:MAG: family 43 glycosylhydrolase [Bacteroidales bacterium]|nr:family 43 glycosylhydrolase [Candidatus Latescibacterota bacterium]